MTRTLSRRGERGTALVEPLFSHVMIIRTLQRVTQARLADWYDRGVFGDDPLYADPLATATWFAERPHQWPDLAGTRIAAILADTVL